MVIEYLKDDKDTAPFVREFNPWEISGRDQLQSGFFKEVGAALGTDAERDQEARQRVASWRLYELVLAIPGTAAGSIAAILSAQGVQLVWLTATLLGLKAAWQVVKAARVGKEVLRELAKKTLADVRHDLKRSMCSLPRPIILVLDDIDRLPPSEIALLFQLVKANGDFPNLVFLLVFQRDVVESALNTATGVKGSSFLEKVVQVRIDLPDVSRVQLESIVKDEVRGVLPQVSSDGSLDEDGRRWAWLFLVGLNRYFVTLRDVKRYVSTLKFYRGVFSSGSTFEVNQVDLAALEALRLFEPDVYHALPFERDLLTGGAFASIFAKAGGAKRKARADALLLEAPQGRRDQVRGILTNLFPAFGASLHEPAEDFTGDHEGWERARRACSTVYFDRYFACALGDEDISESELDGFLAALTQPAELQQSVAGLQSRGLLGLAFQRLIPRADQVLHDGTGPLLTVLCDTGDSLEAVEGNDYPWGSGMAADILASRLVERADDRDKAGETVLESFSRSSGLVFPVLFACRGLHGSEEAQRSKVIPNLAEDATAKVRALALARLVEFANRSELGDHALLLWLLFRWRDLAGWEQPRTWATQFVASRDGAVRLVTSACREITMSGPTEADEERVPRIDLGELEKFVGLEDLERALASVDPDRLPSKEAEAVRVFRQARQKRARGIEE
jgi:hypothetical protein